MWDRVNKAVFDTVRLLKCASVRDDCEAQEFNTSPGPPFPSATLTGLTTIRADLNYKQLCRLQRLHSFTGPITLLKCLKLGRVRLGKPSNPHQKISDLLAEQ